jgi:aminoglycoside phosphotransferase family enzyme/predicted kinase
VAIPPEQAETAAFLRSLAGAEPVETHISLVFVGADTVWKLKKSVRLPFLDFTDAEARRRFAERELALNAPAAPGLYRDVVPVVRRPDGTLALNEDAGAEASPVDWVLRMARVPPEHFLDAIAAAGRLDAKLLDVLADSVAAYHAQCSVVQVDVAQSMRAVTQGNARSALHAGLPTEQVAEWERDELAALDSLATWQAARAQAGFVRRCHGDLHLGNLCLWQGRPVPFDALEFDEAMATIDVGYDLAFLLMDLDRRASRAAANRVLNRYVARTGDAALMRALHPYLSQRAMVLAHVQATRHRPELAASYFEAALAYLHPATQPVVVAVGGLQGTGKSTLARALAPELGAAPGALVLRSDEIRKRQHGAAPEQRLSSAAYTEAASNAVFAALADDVRETAAGGHAVVADATFIDPAHRRAIWAAARDAGVPFVGLWLDAPLPVLEVRLAARTADASDATASVLRATAKAKTFPPHTWRVVDASDAVTALAAARHQIEAALLPTGHSC